MKMIELMAGVWAVGKGDIPQDVEFFRQPSKDGEVQPLLHICERSDDPTQAHPTDIVVLDKVKWDFVRGFYYCNGCKSVFDEEGDLEMIWEDGEGTGYEAHA
jgi:hypothetical protein